jgi:hypothetical protein
MKQVLFSRNDHTSEQLVMVVSKPWILGIAIALCICLALLGIRLPSVTSKKSVQPRPTRKAVIESPTQILKLIRTSSPTPQQNIPDFHSIRTSSTVLLSSRQIISIICAITIPVTMMAPLDALFPSRASPTA